MKKPIIRTSQDLRNLPNYLEVVDPAIHTLRGIVTKYYLRAEYPCGLKSCRQPHKDGYVVELEDGHVSNVGGICGKEFGERFSQEEARYAEQELRPKAIATIQALVKKLPAMQQTLSQLAEDADRLSRYKQGLRSKFPRLYEDVERRAHSGNARITEETERSSQEIEDLLALNPGSNRERLRYREELRGTIPGLQVITANVREAIILKLMEKAESLLSTNVTQLGTEKLIAWENWAIYFDESLQDAQRLVSAGNAFFSPDCFRLLAHLARSPQEKAALANLKASALMFKEDRNDKGYKTAASLQLSKKQRDLQKRVEATLRNFQGK